MQTETADGIERAHGLTALIEAASAERAALRMIVRQAVVEAIAWQRQWGTGIVAREVAKDSRLGMMTLAVSKAALGLQDCVGELAPLWDLPAETVDEWLAEHRRRMGNLQAWFEYRAEAEGLARAVFAMVGVKGGES